MKKPLFVLLFTFLTFFSFSQVGSNDPTFNTFDDGTYGDGTGFNSIVYSTASQSDGKIIAGGEFSSFNGTVRNRIARLNVDGSLDASFNLGTGLNGITYSISIQSDDKIIVGGAFSSFNGIARNGIARLNADGSLDASFDPGTGFNGSTRSISIQSDGKIIVGGQFTSFNGTARNRIARLNADGSLDTSFDPATGFDNFVYSTAIQSDGKIIVGGQFTSFNGATRNRIAQLNTDGSLDPSFDPGTGFNNTVYSTAIQSDGKIIVGGQFTSFNGIARNGIARLNDEGSLNAFFNPGTGFSSTVQSIVIQSDGKIIVGGGFTSFNGATRNRIAQLNTDGSLNPSFDPGTGFNNPVYSTAIQSDGKIIVGGTFTSFNGTTRIYSARLNTNGSLDASFNLGTGLNGITYSISIQSDGKIIVGGQFTSFNGTTRNYIARLNADGSLDDSFHPGTGFNGNVQSISIQSDGKIIVGGWFTSFNGTTRNRIARLNADGSLDTSFDPGTGFNGYSYINSTAIQSDGKIIVGGDFTSFNGTTRNYIARLNPNGSLDASFNSGTGFNSSVNSISIQSDGKIIVGGLFTSFDGTTRNRITRLNANGSLDTSFDPGAGFNDDVQSIAIQTDGKIIVGGYFTSFNGTTRNRITRLNANGSLDTSFDSGIGFNNAVRLTAIQSDGKIIVGGQFTSFNGTTRNRIVRLNVDGPLDASFNIGTGFDNSVHSISIQSDEKIIVGGDFNSFNGVVRNRIARLLNCPSPATGTDFISNCGPYTWIDGIEYTESNTTATFTIAGGTINGCDSIVTLNLTINSGTHNTSTETACESYEWNGTTYTTSGTKIYNYTNGNGCPSTDTLHLTINNGTQNVETETACESYEWNSVTYTTSGTKLYNYTNGNGCPSTDTLHLTINNGTHNVEAETACESYEWNGGTYTTSGTKLYNYTNGNGCPSTDTLHLTINNGTYNVETEIACESFEWNGTTYTTSGTKLYNYTNGSGCPSTDTLHLTINNGTYNASTETACESFEWNGVTYTTSGTKLYNYTNGNGCPSTDTLHLTINNGTYNSSTETACESYEWNGTTYTISGTKIYNYTNGNGCPSTDTLHLTINNGTHNVEAETACESYEWNGATYTTSGTKIYNYTNGSGCPSTDTLHLTINSVDATVSLTGITLTANLSGASYQWIDCDDNNSPIAGETAQTFTALQNGNYAVIVSNGTCDDTSDCVPVNTVGITSLNQNGWNIYPNPTSGMFTISSTHLLDNALVEIHSADGKLIYTTVFSGTEMSFNIGNNPPGVYILRVDNKDTFRVIKN